VSRGELAGTGQISNRPSDLQDPMIRPCGEVEPPDSLAQHGFDRFMKAAVTSKIPGAHVSVRVHASLTAEAYPLNGPCTFHSPPDN
jgi:hypothetical protein